MKNILFVFLFLIGISWTNPHLQIKGSDSLIDVVQKLSEEYMALHPEKIVVVTGGGTGAGIAALINASCDIANASRFITQEEIKAAQFNGVSLHSVQLALDGLCIIANSNNKVTELTLDQVGALFRGEVRNWKELGGSDMALTLYGRQSNSGAYIYLREKVLRGEYSSNMLSMHSDTQIIESVKHDLGAVGYSSSAFVNGGKEVSVIKLAIKKGEPFINPLNPRNILNGKYPLSRPLLQYYREGDAKVQDFIAFELSHHGQKIFAQKGFIPIPKNRQSPGQ